MKDGLPALLVLMEKDQMMIILAVNIAHLEHIHLLNRANAINVQKEPFRIGVIHLVLLAQKDITVILLVHLNVKDVQTILILILVLLIVSIVPK